MIMLTAVNTKDIRAIQSEVESAYETLFPEADSTCVQRAFQWINDSFAGRYGGYQRIDARYHDLEHTLQGTLCLVHLLRGLAEAGASPPLTARMFELGLLSILFHDTGYLKERGDQEGTGAKYTLVHVTRSSQFARKFLTAKGYSPADIGAVQNMIRCTGVNVDLATIPFTSEIERIVGFALGTADLLGQMAAADYVEKLPVLYLEFAEAARYNKGKTGRGTAFKSVDDLMRKTPMFWDYYVIPKINKDFRELYRFLSDPYPDGPNYYLQQVEENIAALRKDS